MYFLGIGSSSSVKCGTDSLHLKLKISYFGHFYCLISNYSGILSFIRVILAILISAHNGLVQFININKGINPG